MIDDRRDVFFRLGFLWPCWRMDRFNASMDHPERTSDDADTCLSLSSYPFHVYLLNTGIYPGL